MVKKKKKKQSLSDYNIISFPLEFTLEIRETHLWRKFGLVKDWRIKGMGMMTSHFNLLTEVLMGHAGCILVGVCTYDSVFLLYISCILFHKWKTQTGQWENNKRYFLLFSIKWISTNQFNSEWKACVGWKHFISKTLRVQKKNWNRDFLKIILDQFIDIVTQHNLPTWYPHPSYPRSLFPSCLEQTVQ